jgi:hypothetical protein
MAHNEVAQENADKDFKSSWVKSSRFLFYVQVVCLVAFIFGGCYSLYKHRYPGKPKEEVPGSSLISNPVYK